MRLLAIAVFVQVLFASILTSHSVAAVVEPSDVDYQKVEDHGFIFIYPEEYQGLVPDLIKYTRYFNQVYEESFSWTLDERTALVLASSHNQIANGFATIIPNNLTVFFGGGAAFLDSWGVKSWLYVLVSHEISHLYQLNPKQDLSKFLKSIFGNILYFPTPIIIPVFVSPNIFLPTLFLEGNAAFNEARFGNGGRLYSGEFRALVYALIKSGRMDPTRMINDHLSFPYGHEKYLVGAYFNRYLARKYGLKTTNSFFLAQSTHYLLPTLINSTYEQQFGVGLYEAMEDFVKVELPNAEKQVALTEAPVFNSLSTGPLNADKDKIYFLTSDDNKSTPLLNIFNKQSKSLTQSKLDVPMGKLFELDGEFYSAASSQSDPTHVTYSLYSDGIHHREEYDSKIVTDIMGQDVLYLDAEKSFDEPKLYKGKEFIATSNSSGLFDAQKNIYYFKQEGKKRSLYKNQEKLFTYEGYYGKLVDVISPSEIFFIAATPYGSTLFLYDGKSISRLSPADTIIDAKRLNAKEFFVTEVGPDGYAHKVIEEKKSQSGPALFDYFFDHQKDFTALDERKPEQPGVKPQGAVDYKEPFNLRYSSLDIIYGYSSFTGVLGGGQLLFVDPMAMNALEFAFFKFSKSYGGAAYSNTRHRLAFDFGYSYTEYFNTNFDNSALYPEQALFADASYPLFKYGSWHSSLKVGVHVIDRYKDSVPVLTELSIAKSKAYSLSFLPYRYYALTLSHEAHRMGSVFSGSGGIVYDVGYENIFDIGAGADYSKGGKIRLVSGGGLYHPTSAEHATSLLDLSDVEQKGSASIGYTKVLNWGLYFYTFPLSMRRLAPFVRFEQFAIKTNYIDWLQRYQEFTFGVTLEFLFNHKIPFPLTLKKTNLLNNKEAFSAMVGFAHDF